MLKALWFQAHWLLGISAGAVLAVMGVSGATLAFEDELLGLLNRDIVEVVPHGERLAPPQLAVAAQALRPSARIQSLTVYADPRAAARLSFAAADPQQRRGELVYVDPYRGTATGTQQQLRGHDFLHLMEDIHRRLAGGDAGKAVTGACTIILLVLTLSGLYLRWPRRFASWRSWFHLDFSLRGRSLLWNLHSTIGTWLLPFYLLAALSGLFFAYDWYRGALYAITGESPPQRQAPGAGAGASREGRGGALAASPRAPVAPPALDAAWARFLLESGGNYRQLSFNPPARPGLPMQLSYLAPGAAHDRAFSRLTLDDDGSVREHQRYADKSAGAQLIASMFPLHAGSFFGWPGQLLMLISSLLMPLFFVTGWLLYLDRRRKKHALRRTRIKLPAVADGEPWLLAFASQSGFAERLAWQTATGLTAGGQSVVVRALADCDATVLAAHRRALFVLSTFGDGEPPDSARRFVRRTMAASAELPDLRFGLLALGDRHYGNFCGFGHTVLAWLQQRGAHSLFAPVEVDGGDAAALEAWRRHINDLGARLAPLGDERPFAAWRLVERVELNPGSLGGPSFLIRLAPHAPVPDWQAGDIAEIRVPAPQGTAVREYSIASLPQDGYLDLVVRQTHSNGKLGLGSGWLTVRAGVGGDIELRIRANPAFRVTAGDAPLLLIGNGTGIAGLRAHWHARAHRGPQRNWLVFGERQRRRDFYFHDEIGAALRAGQLARVDAVFSRDGGSYRYVQDVLRSVPDDIRDFVAAGACVLVCGSLDGMAPAVDAALREALGEVEYERMLSEGRYRRDVY